MLYVRLLNKKNKENNNKSLNKLIGTSKIKGNFSTHSLRRGGGVSLP